MEFYLAPMEGITGYVYRNQLHKDFGGVTKFMTPFLAPVPKKVLKTKERRDIDVDNNEGIPLVPQVLTKSVEGMLQVMELLQEKGYREVNINLGCPASTVVTKGKGSGFLKNPEDLDRFLEGVFDGMPEGMELSVKTRLGFEDPMEFKKLLAIYNRYPIMELTVHPRVRQDFYGNEVNLEMFAYALSESRCPVVYNGDIVTVEDYQRITERFPQVDRIMIGRGLIGNPALVRQIRGGAALSEEELHRFLQALYESYSRELGNHKDAMFRLKEVWGYVGKNYPDRSRAIRNLIKAKNEADYEQMVRAFFS
ncbi:MAG: tRNA-dihydrouridine synthase family protein [Lachnospiraceae bacterium]|nr:tRNA-dihydrouridine synthase family protein [Lachnospiraceae bacterium]